MNTDIKFRSWHPGFGEMIFANTDNEFKDKREWYPICFKIGFSHYPHSIMDDETIIMQYIGIKAKNKDVYEGDIIAVNGKYPKIVRRSKSGFNFCLVNISDLQYENIMDIEQFPDKKWLEDYKDELEVIGNIFENPELLNDK